MEFGAHTKLYWILVNCQRKYVVEAPPADANASKGQFSEPVCNGANLSDEETAQAKAVRSVSVPKY